MWYILTCPIRKYYIEYRTPDKPQNYYSNCAKDPLGRYITDIKCYTITNDKIIVDYKKWLKENK